MNPRRAIAFVSVLAACGEPAMPSTSATSATSGESEASGASSSSSASAGSTASSDATSTSTGTSTSTSTSTSAESTTTAAPSTCHDGVIDPGELCLLPPELIQVGVQTVDLTLADLDRDGHLDLAFADINGPALALLYGLGDGSFAPPLTFPGIYTPRAVAAHAVSPSAPLDLTIADLGVSAIGHYRSGDRPRTYGLPEVTEIGAGPRALLAADLDDDGDDDLAAISEGADVLSLIFLDGGEITTIVVHPVGEEPYGLAHGDVDGDGRGDLVVVNRKGESASILRAEGGGGFAAAATILTAADPRSVTLADVDRDGDLDLAVACYQGRMIEIHRNAGDGLTFDSIELHVDAGIYAIVAGDVDHDGGTDLAAVDLESQRLMILRRFDLDLPQVDLFPLSAGAIDLVIGDLNEDGALDLAVAATFKGGVDVLLADP